ncbi:MAG: ATP-binding protein [Chloroflexi bacterium]|nr:ATP-binding protein [Chloroflexota bacterium]
MPRITLRTGPGVFEVLAHVCRSPLEAVKQFVENAADAIELGGAGEGHISVKLQYEPARSGETKGLLKSIAIQDNGMGMTSGKMEQVLQQIGNSEKLDSALRGEQGIGILAFALLAGELHLASSAADGRRSSCLVLRRSWLKEGRAEIIERCPAHQHDRRGTVAHLENVLAEIAPQLSKDRLKDYLGQQFATDLKANLYDLSISDDHNFEQIHPQRFRGVKVMSASLSPGHPGAPFVEIYVLPWEMTDAAISLYGRGGTRICSLTDLEGFKGLPWSDRRLEGYIRYDRLKRTADKTALVQDQVFNDFVAELRKIEPHVQELILKVSAESQEHRFDIVLGRVGRLIDRFLRYRDRGLLTDLNFVPSPGRIRGDGFARRAEATIAEREPSTRTAESARRGARAETRAPHIKLNSPSGDRAGYRSWFDPGQGVICINREHTEFLLSQRDERRCMRYLFSIWAKESLLQEYGPQAEKIADELVGVLAEAEPLLW